VVATRRALFGAGAAAFLVAGCGPPEEAEVDVRALLETQYMISTSVADSYEGVPLTQYLRANAEARARRVADAIEQLPGANDLRRIGVGIPEPSLERALLGESLALPEHVAAIGKLPARYRDLMAGLIEDSAAAQTELRARLRRPPLITAFPGEPV
jgi:hypothetical protein